jgi:hypothetical protein
MKGYGVVMDIQAMINEIVVDKRVKVINNRYMPISASVNINNEVVINLHTTLEGFVKELSSEDTLMAVKIINELIHNTIVTNGYQHNLEAFIYFIIAHEYGHALTFLENGYTYIEVIELSNKEHSKLRDEVLGDLTEDKFNAFTKEELIAFNLKCAKAYRELPLEKDADEYALNWLANKYAVVCV